MHGTFHVQSFTRPTKLVVSLRSMYTKGMLACNWLRNSSLPLLLAILLLLLFLLFNTCTVSILNSFWMSTPEVIYLWLVCLPVLKLHINPNIPSALCYIILQATVEWSLNPKTTNFAIPRAVRIQHAHPSQHPNWNLLHKDKNQIMQALARHHSLKTCQHDELSQLWKMQQLLGLQKGTEWIHIRIQVSDQIIPHLPCEELWNTHRCFLGISQVPPCM